MNLNEFLDFKQVPDRTGWFISVKETLILDMIPCYRIRYLGPYIDKVSAVTEVKDIISGDLPWDILEYKVEYYNVSITIDKNMGNWSPKKEDYKKE